MEIPADLYANYYLLSVGNVYIYAQDFCLIKVVFWGRASPYPFKIIHIGVIRFSLPLWTLEFLLVKTYPTVFALVHQVFFNKLT